MTARKVFKMKRYSSVTFHVSPKNPISREKLKITSAKIQISLKKNSWVIWSKTNWRYKFSQWISWQISSNWLFQRNAGSNLKRAQTSDQCYTFYIINRPCVAGAVLDTDLLFTQSVQWVSLFRLNLQNIINHKQSELGSWNFERMFIPHMSCVTYRVSRVTCHVSNVFFCTKWWSLPVQGLLSTRPTLSRFVQEWANGKSSEPWFI